MKEILLTDCSQQPVYKLANQILSQEDIHLTALASAPIENFNTQTSFTIQIVNKNSNFPLLSSLYNSNISKGQLDCAIIVLQPLSQILDFTKYSNISKFIDQQIKSNLLFIRQIDQLFKQQGHGQFIPIVQCPSTSNFELEKVASSAFLTYIDELLDNTERSYQIHGIQMGNKPISEYTDILFQLIHNPQNRSGWVVKSTRKSFFKI